MSGGKCLVLLALVTFSACAAQRVPDTLVDVWRTRAPGYEDRFFEIRSDSLIFGTGGEASSSYPLQAVHVQTLSNGSVRCVFRYSLRQGDSAQLRVQLDPGPPPALHLGSRKETWYREKDATWLAKRKKKS